MPELVQQKGYTGGLSDDDFLGYENSFAKGYNIEIRETPSALTLADAAVKEVEIDGSADILLTIEGTCHTFAFTNTGAVYRRNPEVAFPLQCGSEDGARWDLVLPAGSVGAINGAIEYNEAIYFTTEDKVHRMKLPLATTETPWVTQEIDYATIEPGEWHPMIEVYNKLFIGSRGMVQTLFGGIVSPNTPDLFEDEEVTGLTYMGNYMRIYTKKKKVRGRVYYWDTVSEAYNEFIEWPSLPIHAVVQMDGMDYAYAGRRDIFAVQSYQRERLKKIPTFERNKRIKIPINPYSMTTFDGLIYIGVSPEKTDEENFYNGIYTFGSLNNAYVYSLNLDHYETSGNYIHSVHGAFDYLFFTVRSEDGANSIHRLEPELYQTFGFVESLVKHGASATIDRIINRFQVAYKKLKDGQCIKLYIRNGCQIDEGVWGDPVINITNQDPCVGDNVYRKTESLGEFKRWQYRIELCGDCMSTPELIETLIGFDDYVKFP